MGSQPLNPDRLQASSLAGHDRDRAALFAWKRRTARRLGAPTPPTGAVAFVQRFGSALQLTPNFHVLLPEAVFEDVGGGTRLVPLPPPTDAEVERRAITVACRVLARLRAW